MYQRRNQRENKKDSSKWIRIKIQSIRTYGTEQTHTKGEIHRNIGLQQAKK